MVLIPKAETGPPHRQKRKRTNPYRKRNTPYIALIIIMGVFGLFLQFQYESTQTKELKERIAPLISCSECKGTGLHPNHGFTLGYHSQSAFAQTTLLLSRLSEGHTVSDLTCPKCGGAGMLHRYASRGKIIALFQDALARQALANLVTRPATCRTCSGIGAIPPDPPWDYTPDNLCVDCYGSGFELMHDSVRVWTEVVGEPLSLEEILQQLDAATETPTPEPLEGMAPILSPLPDDSTP